MKSARADLLAGVLLAHREDSTMRYLYECMYGEPMPDVAPPPDNVVAFPKRMSLGLRRKILRDAMRALEEGE
jgi:hypothetical protein